MQQLRNRRRVQLHLPLLLLLGTIVSCEKNHDPSLRTVHRLIGGHIRNADDSELLITSSAGGGRDSKTNNVGGEGEGKKTLSQQVSDGKYGLIQNELFSRPVKKPGILSYDANPEVAKDNTQNLGGLNKSDIWLAENHLLVIRGGSFHEQPPGRPHDGRFWPPIDDYHAPGRQVKLPSNPKVPPPFPVQLTDDGPLQILGANYSTTLNGTIATRPHAVPSAEGGFHPSAHRAPTPPPADPHNPYQANLTAGQAPFPIPPFPPEFGPSPFPVNFAALPPGAAVLPPPGNTSSVEYDEDDPSIYYPPPYSFHYQMDNSTQVPPGPLVPGIVLPPPPDFFALLEPPPRKKPLRLTTTSTTTELIKQIRPTTPAVPPTPVKLHSGRTKVHSPQSSTPLPVTPRVVIRVEEPTTIAPEVRVVPIVPAPHYVNRTIGALRSKQQSVTVLKPVKPSMSTPRPVYFYENNVKPFKIYAQSGSGSGGTRTSVTSTQIPLKAYYSTSHEIDTNSVVTQLPAARTTTTKAPRQYFYYEEHPQRTPKQNFYNLPQEYYKQPRPTSPQQQYYFRPNRPPSRFRFIETTKKPPSDTFSVHVARLKQQIQQYYTTPEPYVRYEHPHRPPPPSPKPVYQFSFQAANYQPPQTQPQSAFRASPLDDSDDNSDKFRPINKYNVEIQPAPLRQPFYRPKHTSTDRPQFYNDYDEGQYQQQQQPPATPKPINEFAFNETPNPMYQYYAKAEEASYLDDITQKYFTIFGKKIAMQMQTTPVPPPSAPHTRRPPVVQIFAPGHGKQVSLHGDTIVNYVRPRPIEPQAEYVRQRRPQTASKAIPTPAEEKPGSYISYELPGDDGAHFYFLTPQLAASRDQGAGFYFENPKALQQQQQQQQQRKGS